MEVDGDAQVESAAREDEFSGGGDGCEDYESAKPVTSVSIASSADGYDNNAGDGLQNGGAARFHEAVHVAFVDAQKAVARAIESARLRVSQAHDQAFGADPGYRPAVHSPRRGGRSPPAPMWFGADGDAVGRKPLGALSALTAGLAAAAAEDNNEDAGTKLFAKMVPTAARWMQDEHGRKPSKEQGRKPSKEHGRKPSKEHGRKPSKEAAQGNALAPGQAGGLVGFAAVRPRHSVNRVSLRNPDMTSVMGRRSIRRQEEPFALSMATAKQGSMRSAAPFHKQNSLNMDQLSSIPSCRSVCSCGEARSVSGARPAAENILRVQLSSQPSAAQERPAPGMAGPPTGTALALSVRATSRPALPSEDPPPPLPPTSEDFVESPKYTLESLYSPKNARPTDDSPKTPKSPWGFFGRTTSDMLTSSHGIGDMRQQVRTMTSDASGRRGSTSKLVNVMEVKQLNQSTREITKKTTWFSEISWEYVFNGTIGIAIVLNCLAIGASADTADWWVWPFIDIAFAVVFTVEMFVKMRFGGIISYFLGRGFVWNLFDFVLVFVAWLEVSLTFMSDAYGQTRGMSTVRILRIARAARVLRVCKLSCFADLAMMINGAIGGIRTFFWSQVVLAVPLYTVAILLRNSLGDQVDQGDPHSGAEYFGTLVLSYFTSFRCLVASECFTESGQPIFVLITKNFGWVYGALYIFMNVLMTFALCNIIVAIFVENTLAAAKENELRQKQQRLTDASMFHRKALELVDLIYEQVAPNKDVHWDSPNLNALMDEAMQVRVSREAFEDIVQLERFQKILRDMDIDVAEQLDLFDTLDVDGGGTIDLEELLTGIHRLRGDARRSDIVGTALRVNAIQDYLIGFEAEVSQQFALLRTALNVQEDVTADGTGV